MVRCGELDCPRGVDMLGEPASGGNGARGDSDGLLLLTPLVAVRSWLAVFRIDAGVGSRRGLSLPGVGVGHGVCSEATSLSLD
jgi:hypothetical protein